MRLGSLLYTINEHRRIDLDSRCAKCIDYLMKTEDSEIINDLKASELRYRRLFEAAQDGILILDAKPAMVRDTLTFRVQ